MKRRTGHRGFTLVEALITLAVLTIAMLLIAPALQNMIRTSKLEGVAREASQLVHLARLEAAKMSIQTVVRVADGEVLAFADRDGETAGSAPDGIFNPVAGSQPRETDYVIGRTSIPSSVSLARPGGGDPIDGLTPVGPDRVLMILADGSADSVGAYRFADGRGNFLEVRIAPRATARVTVAKWDPDTDQWWSRGEGGRPWRWH